MKLTIQLAALLAIVILSASAQTLTSFEGGTVGTFSVVSASESSTGSGTHKNDGRLTIQTDDGSTATLAAPVSEPASWVIAGVALFLVSVILQRRELKERR